MSALNWKTANAAGNKSGDTRWPTLEAGTSGGTQIAVSGDYFNSDLTLTTFKEYDRQRLLELAKRLAAATGRPQTDFILARGRRLIQVDLEFNKLVKRRDNSSDSAVPIGAAVEFLKASDLPRPLGVFIDKRKHESVRLGGHALEESEAFDADKAGSMPAP